MIDNEQFLEEGKITDSTQGKKLTVSIFKMEVDMQYGRVLGNYLEAIEISRLL